MFDLDGNDSYIGKKEKRKKITNNRSVIIAEEFVHKVDILASECPRGVEQLGENGAATKKRHCKFK